MKSSTGTAQRIPRRPALAAAFSLALAVFAADQAIKWLVESTMRLGESIVLIPGVLSLTYIHNEGGAFGILSGSPRILMVGSLVAVVVVLWMLLAEAPSRLTVAACGLILGGAAGNLADRLATGRVTDYVHFSFWYVFNAADAAITLGVVLLLLATLLRPEKDRSSG
ncbi:Lipoprotein signal peptidase [Rubrobacter xylanophilus DSM 9941]|uniref:signal peptidase II n=1 Tax=Rubrobacter xylanophilus TaxID=49319 RepID=UPI001C63F6EA|nr:signal peptidase II [Rubrobacter xylanophilus]QYJ15848.1 Lipoprotein signal peptidase [Rubrobacter xylanophilus DSM 9941]